MFPSLFDSIRPIISAITSNPNHMHAPIIPPKKVTKGERWAMQSKELINMATCFCDAFPLNKMGTSTMKRDQSKNKQL
jgi:hypothetical protein